MYLTTSVFPVSVSICISDIPIPNPLPPPGKLTEDVEDIGPPVSPITAVSYTHLTLPTNREV